jgi:hypothetical protein
MFSLNNNAVSADADIIDLSAKGRDFSKATLTVAAELMKNQQHASPLDPSGDIEVAQDSNGWPMIFTIGTDKKFYLVRLDSQAAGGYTIINLSDDLAGGREAVAFGMTQDNKGKISITLALAKKAGGDTLVFTASCISNNTAETDWTKFASFARSVSGIDPAFAVERMLMSSGDNGQAPVSIIAGNLKGYKYYYLLDGNGKAGKYEFPEDVKRHPDALKDISIGYAFGQTGIFFIYDIGETQTLACTTIADAELGSLSYDYSPGNVKIPEQFRKLRYNCISTPTGSKNKASQICSDIFIGAPTGVYFFKNSAVNQCLPVTEKLKDVHGLEVRQDKDTIVVWASTAGNKLYYIYGKKVKTEEIVGGKKVRDEKYEWNDPVLFKDDVLHIAPIRNTTHAGNELYLVSQDKTIRHYWQDSGSTLWRQQMINIPEQGDVIEFNSYTTHLHFEDDKGKALVEEKVQITASEWTYVVINGFVYSLDQGSSAEVSTDIMGNVTIITMTNDIACPVYHLTAEWLDKTLNIYPNAKVTRGLAQVKSAGDLKNARTEDGKPVLSGSAYDDATLDAVAGNISQLAGEGDKLKNGNRNASGRFLFTAVEPKGVLHTGRFSVDRLPDNFMLSYGNSGALALVAAPGDIFNDIKNFAGDALHYLSEFVNSAISAINKGLIVLENGVKFVLKKVDEGLQFVLAIGDQLLNIVLDTLGAVFQALNWVLKLVGIDLEKILEWLGRLLGWTDILETSDKICEVVLNSLDMLPVAAQAAGDKVNAIFREVELQIAGEDIVNGLGDVGKSNQTNGQSAGMQNPAANWVNYQLLHGKSSTQPLQAGNSDDAIRKIEEALVDLLKKEILTGGKAVSMIMDLLSHITTDNIGQTMVRLLQILAVTALEEVKNGLLAALKIVELVVVVLKAELNMPMYIPILSGVLKRLMGGRDFTVLRVMSLAIALPLRLFYRIATGDAFPQEKIKTADPEWMRKGIGAKSMRAVSVGEMAYADASLQLPGQGRARQPETWVVACYEVSRVLEVIFGSMDLFANLTQDHVIPVGGWQDNLRNRKKYVSGIKVACGLFCTTMFAVNLEMVTKSSGGADPEEIIAEVSPYEWANLSLSFVKAAVGFVGACLRSPEHRRVARGISALFSLLLAVWLSIEFGIGEKNRSANLRFTSNLFMHLYKMVGDCPFKVGNPKAAAAICAGFALLGATHISLVAARSFTDKEDNASFKVI